jgi:hypothetical protein
MSELEERLRQKGWTENDIQQALQIIQKAQAKKTKPLLFLDSIIYWLVLFAALIGNFIISIILIPFMLTITGFKLIAIIILIGFAFGAFFDLLIRDIKNLENKDVIIAGIFLPLLALMNVSLMVRFANYLQLQMGLLTPQHDPWVISAIYVCAFMLPHVIQWLIKHKKPAQQVLNSPPNVSRA